MHVTFNIVTEENAAKKSTAIVTKAVVTCVGTSRTVVTPYATASKIVT